MNATEPTPCTQLVPSSPGRPMLAAGDDDPSRAELVIWTADLSVDDAALDRDHRVLFHLANGLQAMRRSDGPADDVAFVVGRLQTALADHFAREERYLEETGYPCLEAHRNEHRELLRRCAALQRRGRAGQPEDGGKDGRDDDVTASEAAVLVGLTLGHIIQSDLHYREHLRRQPAVRQSP